jgi:hypothetical protein
MVLGKIATIGVADATNYGVRVFLNPGQVMCGTGTPFWAFIPAGFNNYQAMLSLLTTSWIAGKNVVIYTTRTSSGYCEIGFVSAS